MILNWFRSAARPPRIGTLALADAPALARLHAEAFARPWDAHDIERLLADPAIVGDGAWAGKHAEPAGFALSRTVLDEAEVLTIVVARHVQGRGCGRALLAAHLAHLAARRVKLVFLEVEEGNNPAIHLYRLFGFTDSGRREGYYLKADGRRVSALVMRLAMA